MATALKSHVRNLMWYDGGNLLLLCHNRNILYMLALSLMVRHCTHANVANTSVIKKQAAYIMPTLSHMFQYVHFRGLL